ncbi:hypothetical protein FOA52_007780 [Chlamydomonas sp. UWO 241]|nr:hypothetical protein FOA52_007780 [Chlamydomonas sp. UWO 241]
MEASGTDLSAAGAYAGPGSSNALAVVTSASAAANAAANEICALKARLKAAAQGLAPAIFRRRTREAELLQELGIRVLDWSDLRMSKEISLYGSLGLNHGGVSAKGMPSREPHSTFGGHHQASVRTMAVANAPKMAKAVKSKSNASGRKYTSKFRGVHQTFPTRRWEAQFRRNSKPTSLGCFDAEEEAAKAYDKMMLWCELHNTAAVKGGITNFEASEYEADLPFLQQCTQDELIEALRSKGRKQAAQRMMRQKREATHGTTDEEGGSVATADK